MVRRKEFPRKGPKTPIASIAVLGRNDDIPSRINGLTTMERTGFEPFGEQLVSATDNQPQSRASKLLLRAGTGVFWALVAGIVLARAAFFEPGVYDSFGHVASLARNLLF
jgi:hypothetical protein